jgi:SAM-dependent methyltransferase
MKPLNLFRRRNVSHQSGIAIGKEKTSNNAKFISEAYGLVLNRAPDPDGLDLYGEFLGDGRIDREELFRILLNSTEYKNRYYNNGDYDVKNDRQYDGFISDEIDKLSVALEGCDFISMADMDRASEGLLGLEYYVYHRKRFLEMMNGLAFIERSLECSLNILEIGSIFTTKIIRELFPDAKISTLDALGADEIGYGGVYMLKDIVNNHYQIDLVRDKIENIDIDKGKKFDIILLCEVVEHLLLNPAKLFKFILRQMSSGGYLYITTPNAFKKSNVESLKGMRLPFPAYPEEYSYEDAFMFHVREYGMAELLGFVRAAGGVVRGFYFSDCWDDPTFAASLSPHERGNLVVLVQKP